MAAPVQVVMEAGRFVTDFAKSVVAGRKDLFASRNEEFQKHRDRLARQVRSLANSQAAFGRSSVAIARVELRPEGLAKSNRPRSLFEPSKLPMVGTARAAELLIQVSKDSLRHLADRIGQVPMEVPLKEKVDRKTGEVTEEPNPSQLRCDVGVVQSISLWDQEQRLPISLDRMMQWYRESTTSLSLIVRLFNLSGTEAEGLQSRELRDLIGSIELFGCEVEVDDQKDDGYRQRVLLVSLRDSKKYRSPASALADWISALPHVVEALMLSPIVRTVHVPARISSSASAYPLLPGLPVKPMPAPSNGASYPVVGVIDGGICASLAKWTALGDQYVMPIDGDTSHGTVIAGLLVLGQELNGSTICPEPDGCTVVDICLMPKDDPAVFRSYYDDSSTLFSKIESAVIKAKKDAGARVFNFSFNLEVPQSASGQYCYETERLDSIAWRNNVVFVISAGNLPRGVSRVEWPSNPTHALSILAQKLMVDDGIHAPADSMANVSVSAINPPNVPGFIDGALAAYSRRGPSIFGGLKPDLAHFGGCYQKITGLNSIDTGGVLAEVHGTSYSAPLVAKTMARYCQLIHGEISRELMIALVIHNSRVPELFSTAPLSDHAKDLVGFGVPLPAEPSIQGSDSSITLVFEARIPKGKRFEFRFSWPKSLVKNGKCRGRGRLTLVSRPSVKSEDGEEFTRTQLDAHVNQLGSDGRTKGGFFSIRLPESIRGKNAKARESELRRHQLKWGPVKVYEFESPEGKGETSQWRLVIEALEREENETPGDGIPFAALLTIEDLKAVEPVYADLRQDLLRYVELEDIQVASRARPRRGSP